MRLRIRSTAVLLLCLATPLCASAASVVFAGDPINPATSLPYEMLPGRSLVLPGADGRLGTADDIVNPSVVGDIDMVVRSGALPAAAVIPSPAALGGRSGLPVGVAGSSSGGGTEIPFTVFLSDGAVNPNQPFGALLPATDMDGIPVVVAAFADFDRDGFVGPTDADAGGAADNGLEVREIEAVGRAVAIFSGGVARGSVAIRAGLPASVGGLTIALTAQALTGPFDPAFFDGNVPIGPAISTALPFLPERDLARLIRGRTSTVSPTTTLQQVVQFASIPAPSPPAIFALRLDGSEGTIDAAVVQSQAAVSVAFREDIEEPGLQRALHDLTFGTRPPANWLSVRVLAVDRWGNPSDPPAGMTIALQATPPLNIFRPARARAGRDLVVREHDGVRLRVRVPRRIADGTTGTLRAERDGAVVAVLPFTVDDGANRFKADISVPRGAATIQAAVDAVFDRNRDGVLAIDLAPGLYRETLAIDRPISLRGAGMGTTLVQGAGSVPTISVAATGVRLRELTAVGGSSGFALAGGDALLLETRAWRNVGAGISVSGPNPHLWRATADDNGGDGLVIEGAANAVCTDATLVDNRGGGAIVSAVQSGQFTNNQIADNGACGVCLTSVEAMRVADNESVNNLGSGFELSNTQGTQLISNLSALNDEDGLSVDSTDSNLVSANVFSSNNGYGLFVRRSTDDDFSAAAGLQAPLGDNASSDNRKGDLFVRPD